jgi:hypothetical protein
LLHEPRRDVHSTAEAELVPYLFDVILGRALCDGEAGGDLSVGHACGDQSRNFALARAQRDPCYVRHLAAG